MTNILLETSAHMSTLYMQSAYKSKSEHIYNTPYFTTPQS